MYTNNFEYLAPKTPGEAFELVGRLGSKARILAGGTDLIVLMKDKVISPEYVIDIKNIKEFKGIKYEPGKGMEIGATTKIAELQYSEIVKEKYPALAYAASQLGSNQVRHMATIGGNSCNASPSGETPTPLVAYGAKVVLSSAAGDRELPLEDFITGVRRLALQEGEILTKFILPEPSPNSVCRYTYAGARDALEIDCVNMAVNLELENDKQTVKYVKFVMGSVFIRPLVSEAVPALLIGQKFSDELVEKAAAAAQGEAMPISDVRASEWYRNEMVGNLTRKLLKEAFAAAREV
ncbi:Carbon monoxide dehydrogenase medium chain [Pelotomaculum schinkii]|uniref:Carbon monoxide dehydrogenase medium chain n=1 Tax=Pelotomaculum schinkii TaxID=78350 RepID=A0A4Y7RBR7_9FIRM|nr:xanthine dehydrogenase family protein subunit M [Pelotomaculum schinkii]TEB06209.1 Carbon monoxide dehydrogenase medium chain [Pelotomaculum schinkii]